MRYAPLVIACTFFSATASAQMAKDNTPAPIDVPTAPVPQNYVPPPAQPVPAAKPKPAAAPAPAPAPAPGPAPAPAPGPAPAPAPGAVPADPKPEESSSPKYNNEGVFKISGTKGQGVVGAGKTGPKTTSGKPASAGKAGATTTTKAGKAAAKAMVAQWPGFRMTDDGGSEVMVEFSQNPTTPTEHRAAGAVTYIFKGAHVIKSNNQNPLITVHFNTPVASARLTPKKGELHLVVNYRAGADAAPSSGLRASSDGDGQQFFVKFGSGSFLPKGSENDTMPPPPTQKLKNNGDKAPEGKPASGNAPPPKTDAPAKTGPNP